jgi:Protein of unknown function (DUF3159)
MPGSPTPDPTSLAAEPSPRGAPLPEQREAGSGQPPLDDAQRAAAYEASVLAAFGGRRGLAEVGLPSIVFIGVYAPARHLDAALYAAVAVGLALTVSRLFKRDTLQHALGGLLGVVVCALAARITGQAKDFYLPTLLLNIGEALLFAVSALVRWPAVGVVLGPVTGEMMAWRAHPLRLRAFIQSTWLLAAMFAVRVAIEVPLYLANQITALGIAKIVLGWPLYLATAYVCWQIIRKAPLPENVGESAGGGTPPAEGKAPAVPVDEAP